MRFIRNVSCVLLAWVIAVASAQSANRATCAVASLFDVCVLVGHELGQEQRQEIAGAYPAEEASMLDIKQAAESLGIVLPEMQVGE